MSAVIPEEVLKATHDALQEHASKRAAAAALGINESTLRARVNGPHYRAWLAKQKVGFEVPELPSESLPVEEIIAKRIREFEQVDAAFKARELVPVKINLDGPIGVSHWGDPHIDDPGTDLRRVMHHTEIINRTEGLFAANIGDTTNNWMFRLVRLYEHQSTTGDEAWKLAEWFVTGLRWLYFLDGNHNAWSGSGNPLKWMLNNCGTIHDGMGCRLVLNFPNGKAVRINARHDFPGNSMWNAAHGPMRAVQMGWRDHLLVCGHRHVSAYGVLKDPASKLISHAIRVAAYKQHDHYAKTEGFPDGRIFDNAVTIINPRYNDDDPRLITTLFDLEHGADYLTWLRSRKS